jgi:hypothetical protein
MAIVLRLSRSKPRAHALAGIVGKPLISNSSAAPAPPLTFDRSVFKEEPETGHPGRPADRPLNGHHEQHPQVRVRAKLIMLFGNAPSIDGFAITAFLGPRCMHSRVCITVASSTPHH